MTLSSHPHLSSQLPLPFHSSPTPEEIFARVFRRLCAGKLLPQIRVTFREWAQLRSTIRLTRAGVEVEISDTLRDASAMVLEALAEILICRLNGSRPSREARACYLSCIMSPPMRQRIDEARRARGFKLMRPAKGRCFDLRQIFDQLNREYFQGELRVRQIGWSRSPSRTILGHHDPAHETITISKSLDRPAVPRLLVEFIVFHEMLHVRYAVERNHHRRIIHSAQFRAAEKQFAHYSEAQRLLKSGKWGAGWEG
jgi:hypothetical protein